MLPIFETDASSFSEGFSKCGGYTRGSRNQIRKIQLDLMAVSKSEIKFGHGN